MFEGDHRKRRSEKLGKGMVEEVQLGPELARKRSSEAGAEGTKSPRWETIM
jgi:hypothetical protein